MAARRRKATNGDGNGHAFAVLEEMRGHFKAYGEALEGVRIDIHVFKQDIHGLKQDVHGLKQDVHGLRHDVDSLRHDVDGLRHDMEAGFEQVDRRFDRLEAAVLEHTRELKELRVAVDRKVDRDQVEGIVERVIAGTSPDQKG
jgi:predicted RNase H-like nuclease (RuvC/YqgF family)